MTLCAIKYDGVVIEEHIEFDTWKAGMLIRWYA